MRVLIMFLMIKIMLIGSTLKPLTVLIDFPDYRYTQLETKEEKLTNNRRGKEFTKDLYADMFYSEITYKASNGENMMTARNFFQLESGGAFFLEGDSEDIYGWFTAKREMKFYGKTIKGKGDTVGAVILVREVIDKLVENKVDFSKYDKDGDGVIDHLVVIFAGRGEQFDNSMGSNAIWPHYNTFADISKLPYTYFEDHTGKLWAANNFMLLPQDIPLDLYVHEMGHYLGISDLYGKESTIGYWSSMSNIYSGDIVGTKMNSYGAYHRNNLQNIYNEKNIRSYWAQTKEYDIKNIAKKDVFVKLYSSNNKKKDNLIKVKLPSHIEQVSFEDKKMYYSDNYLNKGSSFSFTVTLPKGANNRLMLSSWFNSEQDRNNARIYVRSIDEEKWIKVENKISINSGPKKWVPGEFDLNKYSGKTIEIKGMLLPSIKEWRKGVYVSDIRVMSDDNRSFDLEIDRNKIIFDGFRESRGYEKEEKYILIEYRKPQENMIDEGLLRPQKNIPYPGGIVIWYIDETYESHQNLVNILPTNKARVFEVVKGKMKLLNENEYQVSTRVISTKTIPEITVEENGRYYYREEIPALNKIEIIGGLKLELFNEDSDSVILRLSS